MSRANHHHLIVLFLWREKELLVHFSVQFVLSPRQEQLPILQIYKLRVSLWPVAVQ